MPEARSDRDGVANGRQPLSPEYFQTASAAACMGRSTKLPDGLPTKHIHCAMREYFDQKVRVYKELNKSAPLAVPYPTNDKEGS